MTVQPGQHSLFGAEDAPQRLRVLLPLPLAGPYDYLWPGGAETLPPRGAHVIVPLGSREVAGVVWGPGEADLPLERLKAVVRCLEAPPLPADLCDFVDWVAAYTLNAPGAVLALALRAPQALEPEPMKSVLVPGPGRPDRMTPAREKVLAVIADGQPRSPSELAKEAGAGSSVVKGLVECGALIPREVPRDLPFKAPDPGRPGAVLSADQEGAAQVLRDVVAQQSFAPILLDGVTGSGKTEVYFEAVSEALRGPGQVLILLPEIALTVQFLDRFAARFGVRPAQWHSDLGQKERRRVWRGIADGDVRVVVGARSALFLPYDTLSLIVVDEEHEGAFKQEEGVIYQGRDMAVLRARLAEAPVVLASATPSLETVQNARNGRYARLSLPGRAGGARLPEISLLDLREAPPEGRDHWLSPVLVEAMKDTLARGEQTLLFLNRRGYAPLVICRACGHRMTAPDTDSWLVEHRYLGRLVCHQTGFSMPRPAACPACHEPDGLHACGPGVERIHEEVKARFPDAVTAVMSSDTVHGPAAVQGLIGAMARREVDILIGTQMVAKGHNFPYLTLVGVVDGDLGLNGGDLRAGERTYQVLHQVAGRAGRAERPGRVLIQTHRPEHPVMQALAKADRDGFLDAELSNREEAGYPPFGRLAALILTGPDEAGVHETARALAAAAPRATGVTVLGPAPAPIALLRGRHRIRFLVKTGRDVDIQAYLRAWLSPVKIPGKLRLAVDVDPYSFL